MDVYGAFQLCAIGVLAGPVTVKLSRTYFQTPGRNLIFLWTTMILAGLLSLTVEFFRASTVSCPSSDFSYGEDACGLTCSVDNGPWSPMRGGAQNNIYVIKAPRRLNLGTATLLAAACCIPAILSLVSMWNKILKQNWKRAYRAGGDDRDNESWDGKSTSPGANDGGATQGQAKMLSFYLSMVEIPVFGAAVLAILIVGEMNFFDYRVAYMTEPIASVGALKAVHPLRPTPYSSKAPSLHLVLTNFLLVPGQWAPIVGTGLAAVGSLYSVLAAEEDSDTHTPSLHHCDCSHHRPSNDDDDPVRTPSIQGSEEEDVVEPLDDGLENGDDAVELTPLETHRTYQTYESSPDTQRRASHPDSRRRGSRPRQLSLATTSTFRSNNNNNGSPGRHPRHLPRRAATDGVASTTTAAAAATGDGNAVIGDAGNRRKVAHALMWVGKTLGTPAPDAYDNSGFLMGPAADWPEVPGEAGRNPDLAATYESYNRGRDLEGGAATTTLRRERSRAGSFAGSVAPMSSGLGGLGALGIEGLSAAAGPSRASVDRPKARSNTLEVPKAVYLYNSPVQAHQPRKNSSVSSASGEPGSLAHVAADDASASQGPSSPTIRVSSDCDVPDNPDSSSFG